MNIKHIGNKWRVFPNVKPPVEPTDADGDRRLIWVPAVPSSGTSCISGILHHLGVNMGKIDDPENFNRGYQMYEDVDVGLFAYIPNSDSDRMLKQAVRFDQYCNYRISESPPGPIGAKVLPTAWAYCQDPTRLPVDILSVERPIEDVLNADQERMADRPRRKPGATPATIQEHWNRASGTAAMWLARNQLIAMHPPKLTLQFYDVLEDPQAAVDAICEAFGLTPTDEQLSEAVRSVKRK